MDKIKINNEWIPIRYTCNQELHAINKEEEKGNSIIYGCWVYRDRTIYINNSMDDETTRETVLHESIHALNSLKFGLLLDNWELDEEDLTKITTANIKDIVDIYEQIHCKGIYERAAKS